MFGKCQLLILRYPYLKTIFWHFQIKIRLCREHLPDEGPCSASQDPFEKKSGQGSVRLPDADFFWIIPDLSLKQSCWNITLCCQHNDFQDQSVDLTRARFACMDTTNVNSGERGGLKWYLKSTILHLIWVGCGNHKLSLCFKHFLNQFPSVFETDVFLESLGNCSNTDHSQRTYLKSLQACMMKM